MIFNNNKYLFFWLVILVVGYFLSTCGIKSINKGTISSNEIPVIPKEVKIPEGYKILTIFHYNHNDFNNDGLIDFVFDMAKEKTNNGDSIYLVFYKMNKDSTYSFYKKFSNVIPIHLYFSEQHPDIKDKRLAEIYYDCYRGNYTPLNYFDATNDTITITKWLSNLFMERLRYVFKYNVQKSDWILVNKSRITQKGYYPIEIRDTTLLSQFSYCND